MSEASCEKKYAGLLIIGDPHLEGRSPGFRKDDYPRVILEKLAWSIRYAKDNQLLPVLLGDLFDKPRDNPTWMLGFLLDLFADVECIGIYGNHDCADPQLSDHDSLSLLVKAGRLRLLDGNPWRGVINNRPVIIGGSSYRQSLPETFSRGTLDGQASSHWPLVFWLTHHDLIVPGYEEQGRHQTRPIDHIDLVINGHIHRQLADVQKDQTLWITPGNISRRTRSEATREHIPAILRIDIDATGFQRQPIALPFVPFDEVFHPEIVDAATDVAGGSAFVAGLRELQTRRTDSGAGLLAFLEKNLPQFDVPVAEEIMKLAQETTANAAAQTPD